MEKTKILWTGERLEDQPARLSAALTSSAARTWSAPGVSTVAAYRHGFGCGAKTHRPGPIADDAWWRSGLASSLPERLESGHLHGNAGSRR